MHSDICYEETYYECRICNTNLCSTCQGSHVNNHIIHLVRFVTIAWAATKSIEPQSSCLICSRQVKCRIECDECLTSICNSCYCDNQKQRIYGTNSTVLNIPTTNRFERFHSLICSRTLCRRTGSAHVLTNTRSSAIARDAPKVEMISPSDLLDPYKEHKLYCTKSCVLHST